VLLVTVKSSRLRHDDFADKALSIAAVSIGLMMDGNIINRYTALWTLLEMDDAKSIDRICCVCFGLPGGHGMTQSGATAYSWDDRGIAGLVAFLPRGVVGD